MKLCYVVLVGALLPVGLVLFIGSYCVEQLLRSIARDDAVVYAQAVSSELNAELFDRTVIWKLYGETPFVQDGLAQANEKEISPEFATTEVEDQAIEAVLATKFSQELAAQARAMNSLHGHPVFCEVMITDRRGALVAANNRTSDYWQNDESWWQQAVERGVYVGDKHYDQSAATESIALCLRIDDRSGQLVGVIKAVLDIQDVDSIIRSLPTARVTRGNRKTWLVTKGGAVLGAANVGAVPYKSPCERLKAVGDAGKNGLPAIRWSETDGGPERLISFAQPAEFGKMSNPNWMVLVESDPEATPTSLPQFHYALKFVGLACVIVSGSATYLVSKRFGAE